LKSKRGIGEKERAGKKKRGPRCYRTKRPGGPLREKKGKRFPTKKESGHVKTR